MMSVKVIAPLDDHDNHAPLNSTIHFLGSFRGITLGRHGLQIRTRGAGTDIRSVMHKRRQAEMIPDGVARG